MAAEWRNREATRLQVMNYEFIIHFTCTAVLTNAVSGGASDDECRRSQASRSFSGDYQASLS